MAIRVNPEAVEHAGNLIQGRQYETDSDWSEAQASAEEENEFIHENGWEAFAKWFLAYDTEANEGTKSRYRFPFGDFEATSQRPHRRQTARRLRRLQRGPKRRRQAA